MDCCSTSKKNRVSIRQTEAYLLSHKFRFAPQELLLYQQRFDRIAKGKAFTLKLFRKNMGLLGLKSTRAISDRIFMVMDKDNTGKVTFEQFLEYMDVLMHGTREEKSYQSFRLIAQRNSEVITMADFSAYLLSVLEMRNNLTGGNKEDMKPEKIKEQFRAIDLKQDGVIDFNEFRESTSGNTPIFEWCNLAKIGISEKIDVRKSATVIDSYRDRIASLEKKLYSCIELLNSPGADEISPRSTFISKDAERGPKFFSHPEETLVGDNDIPMSYVDEELTFSEKDTQPMSENIYTEPRSARKSISFKTHDDSKSENDSKSHYSNKSEFESPENMRKSVVLERLKDVIRSMHGLKLDTSFDLDVSFDNNITRRRVSTRYNVPKKITEKKKGVIQWGDEDWSLIVSMMLGIQKAVRAAAANLDPNSLVTPEEFTERSKLNLLPGEITVQNKMCKFRDYSPSIFERIRRRYGITANQYVKSLGVDMIMSSLLQSEFSSLVGLMSSGKSGSFFYYSDDGKYVVKTMTRDEYLFLRRILPDYYEHLIAYPDSLIPRFYGFHKLLSPRAGKITRRYIIVMGNVFSSGHEIHIRYDLKGSTYGRFTDPNEDFSIARKDLDFNRAGIKIEINPEKRDRMLFQMEKDCEFFVKCDIIDYSLLLGIHHTKGERIIYRNDVPLSESESGGLVSVTEEELYFIGIIDILTLYSAKKKLEHLFKSSFYGKEAISCVPSKNYSDRFLNYMRNIFE